MSDKEAAKVMAAKELTEMVFEWAFKKASTSGVSTQPTPLSKEVVEVYTTIYQAIDEVSTKEPKKARSINR